VLQVTVCVGTRQGACLRRHRLCNAASAAAPAAYLEELWQNRGGKSVHILHMAQWGAARWLW